MGAKVGLTVGVRVGKGEGANVGWKVTSLAVPGVATIATVPLHDEDPLQPSRIIYVWQTLLAVEKVN